MSLKSFLKAAEEKVAAVLKGAAKAEPAAAAIAGDVATALGFPEVVPFINRIGALLVGAGGVVNAIQGANGDGAAKLAVATPLVDNLLKSGGFLSDKVIADEQKWAAAVQGITSHFADLLDSVQSKTVGEQPVPVLQGAITPAK